MKKIVDDPRLMIKVCDLYYNQNISQTEIAKSVGMSRPTVSRLLSSAREQGVVQIHISNLESISFWHQERQLEEKYGIKEVIIVKSGNSKDEMKEALGKAAASYLAYTIKDGNRVGVSMGSTLYQAVTYLEKREPLKVKDIIVVPLIGGVGQLLMEQHANSLAERTAHVYNGKFFPLHAPARVSSRLVRDELMKEESLANVLKIGQKLDVALLGIGFPNEYSAIKATGFFKENEIEGLIRKNVAGELCMQFYDENGNIEKFSEYNNAISIDINTLRKVPKSIGVAGGADKVSAVKGAIMGHYINVLITDDVCAKMLLED